MGITITGHGMRVTPDIRQYVVARSKRFEKYGVSDPQIRFILKEEKYRRTAEAMFHVNGLILEAKEETDDLQSAVDQACLKLEKQLKKHHEKVVSHRGAESIKQVRKRKKTVASPEEEEMIWVSKQGEKQAPQMLKRETVRVPYRSLSEALKEMESGKKAFAFFKESGRFQFLFRKNNGAIQWLDLMDADTLNREGRSQ